MNQIEADIIKYYLLDITDEYRYINRKNEENEKKCYSYETIIRLLWEYYYMFDYSNKNSFYKSLNTLLLSCEPTTFIQYLIFEINALYLNEFNAKYKFEDSNSIHKEKIIEYYKMISFYQKSMIEYNALIYSYKSREQYLISYLDQLKTEIMWYYTQIREFYSKFEDFK